MKKICSSAEAVNLIRSGDTILIGGFSSVGCPLHLLYALADRPDINNLTTVSEDFGYHDLSFVQGPEALLRNGQIKKVVVSFLGHPAVEKAYQAGEIELEFVPQGTLAERLRSAGAGIGGFYTPTGVGTEIAAGRETRIIDGKEYLFEKPLRGDVALIKAYKADIYGNAVFKLTASNFNPVMAMAAKTVLLEVEQLVEPGKIEPDAVQLPGIFVDYIIVEEQPTF